MKKLLVLLFFVSGIFQRSIISAQYYNAQTQFTRNEILLNPAYAGSKDYFTLSAYSRFQWVGIDGAPATECVSFFGPVPGKNIGLGLSIMNDKIGVTKQQLINFSYAYKIDFDISFLSLGLTVGGKTYSNNYGELTLDSDEDEYFNAASKIYLIPYTGIGVYYQAEDYNVGLSVPIFLEDVLWDNGTDLPTEDQLFYFLSGAYLYRLENGMVVKSGGLVKGAVSSKLQIDVLTTLYINDEWNFGMSYKSLNSVSLHFEYGYKKQLYFSYSYDIATNSMLYSQWGTHEITLLYLIDKRRNQYFINPRYF